MSRILLIIAGWLAVGLAILGVILPILPTTPFLLLAVICFSRSSKRFHDWLLYRSWFSHYLQHWYLHRAIPKGSKPKAIILLFVTFGLSLYFVTLLWVRVILIIILILLLIFLYYFPVADLSKQK